ncbi:MAG: DEAD/DEAH box helicase family protein [Gammaproteobacteria bacterium]|nr:DEAD/DEAH box helicase family protein [Gammaproteobacteria bacterium]
MTRFEDKLVLSRWILNQFGVERFESLGNALSPDHFIGFDENNNTRYIHELMDLIPEGDRVTKDDHLRNYDDNIVHHWKHITNKRNHAGNTIYPLYFQYLSLLFTEHYLECYFTDRKSLCEELDQFRDRFNQKLPVRQQIEPFKEEDLNKLAFWIATGGGKTLIMHVNILQFEHYRQKASQHLDINRMILLTPNEGLSLQHKEELTLSDIEADLFVKEGVSLSTGTSVEIIDIHKLREKAGEKTIAVESFESNNLVLVDEGHRGAGGVDWMTKRNQLCENGFSFEYSATFGQAIKAAGGSDISPATGRNPSAKFRLSQQYSRCILFDYSYRFFHGEGYGKDHHILNLSHVWTPDQTQLYLSGCILAFYQQKFLYQSKLKEFIRYLQEDPLWIFVGGKVTAKNEANAETVSDIQAILRFISRFVSNKGGESIRIIEQLLNQKDDLRDEANRMIFDKSFPLVLENWETHQAQELYLDILNRVFHASGSGNLHVVHLKGGDGEIGLRVGENDWFGLINVGDGAKLMRLCQEAGFENIVVTDQAFSESLFQGINRKGSSINLLVGAKKFTEGWSSWRVSTMGLMNVGRSEGSEIIQLFGRGIRLRGYGFSLKRSNHIPGINHPEFITILETLNVFGIRSNYVKEFEEYLEAEGLGKESTVLVTLPVIKRLSRDDLKLIRLDKNIPPFKEKKYPYLESPPINFPGLVTLNWYPKIQVTRTKGLTTSTTDIELNEGDLESHHLAFLDFEIIFLELTQYKYERAWSNLQLERKAILDLLADPSWYRLYIPQEILEVHNFDRIRMWQEIAITLLKKYAERYYTFRKNEYEGPHLEYYEVLETDENFINEYKATVDRRETEWIARLNELKKRLSEGKYRDPWAFRNFEAFDFSRHLYKPLVYFTNYEILRISPIPLNRGEHDFVKDLKKFFNTSPDFFEGKELYLLRNQTKDKGIGFFEAGNFYPDFILWVIHGEKQYVCFIDPKGLTHVQGFDDPKVQFHKTVKDIQERLGDPNVFLDSFIVSNSYKSKVAWWSDDEEVDQDFENHHILFQKDDKETYINNLLSTLMASN